MSKTRITIIALICMALFVLLVLYNLKGHMSTDSKKNISTSEPNNQEESVHSKDPKKSYKFGATYMTMSNEYFVVLNEKIKTIVENNGDKLITLDPQLDIEKQISCVMDLIKEKVDVIFLNPTDWKAIKPALLAAKKANIPVIVVDAPVFDDNLVTTTVTSDNRNAGVLCAQDMMHRVEAANIVVLTTPEAKSSIDRINTFEDTIKNCSNYKIIARGLSKGQLEQAMMSMQKVIWENNQINVVMNDNDLSALGAFAALKAAKRDSGVLIYGIDGSPEAKKMIKQGKMTATCLQNPNEIGRIAAEAVYKLLKGEKVERNILVPVELIDKSNVDNYSSGW